MHHIAIVILLIFSFSRVGGAHHQHRERPRQWLHHVLRGQRKTRTADSLDEERRAGNSKLFTADNLTVNVIELWKKKNSH